MNDETSTFDPYHVWLGIPPRDQPPHHYRLLGLDLYEENPDVIDAAANRQSTYLHSMTSGPNRKECQRLLNEIATARLCLLNTEAKQQYDRELKEKLNPPIRNKVAPPLIVINDDDKKSKPRPAGRPQPAKSDQTKTPQGQLFLFVGALVLLLLAGGFFLLKDSGKKPDNAAPDEPQPTQSPFVLEE